MHLLFIGDIFGKSGRQLLAQHLPSIRKGFDFVIANAENAAGGFGLNKESFETITKAGVDAITLGNHTWDNKEVLGLLDDPRVLRPHNYPIGAPGRGWATFKVGQERLTIVNLMGRLFMEPLDNPFSALENILENKNLGAVLVDFHAEATSEKAALARSFDGQVAAVLGTHTHVPTADTRILPKGTLFQTDVGMTGPYESIIGMDAAAPMYRFKHQMPERFKVADGPSEMNAVEMQIENNKVLRAARYQYHEAATAGRTQGEVQA